MDTTTTLKVTSTTRDRVKALGAVRHQSADAVLQDALDELERRVFWETFDAAVDAEGPGQLQRDAEQFAGSLTDGLE